MVIHLSGMHPLENVCGSRLVCIFIWTDLYFNMTAKGLPPRFLMSSFLTRNNDLKSYFTDAAIC